MREGSDGGYDCLLVMDGCGAIIEGLHGASIDMLSTEGRIFGATCSTADLLMVLERIDKMLFYMEEIVSLL